MGEPMSTIRVHTTTSSTPEQFVAGLTDFGPGRAKLFSNSADDQLTEGSHGVWERLHYDWSDPNHVVLTTTASNVWGGRSGHVYTLTRRADGRTDIDVVVVREGKNFASRLLAIVVGAVGSFVLRPQLEKSVAAIEARSNSL
jgi:hypothetical protein